MKKRRVTVRVNRPGLIAKRTANQAQRERLVVQVRRFVTKDSDADRTEAARVGSVPESLVERDGQNFRRNQHHRANLQAGQLAQPAKNSVDPVTRQSRNPLAVQEASQHAAVSLLLCNEKL